MANTISGSSVLVTGGCGFIGSHLVERLWQSGAKTVRIIDSLQYGTPSSLGIWKAGTEILQHRLGFDDPAILKTFLKGTDFLFHLAAEKHRQSSQDPVALLRSNVEGTFSLLQAACEAGVRKVVFTSSLYAYGRTSSPPMLESEPLKPSTLYGVSKAAGELLCDLAFQTNRLEYNVLRLFFIYGPRQFTGSGYRSVIVKNFERLRSGLLPVMNGDGSQSLDYVYIDDAVEALIRVMESDTNRETYNVASGQATTIVDLLKLMASIAGASPETLNEPADWTSGTCRVGDNNKMKKSLAWAPKIGLEQGLRKTYEWLNNES